MISTIVFAREMRRLATGDLERGCLGLHIPAWMSVDGKFDGDLARQLFGEIGKRLRDEDDLKAFVDFLLNENVAGRVRYFPKLSEMKSYLNLYLESTGRTKVVPSISRRYVPSPPPSAEIRQGYVEAAQWWIDLSPEEREDSKELLIKRLADSGNTFIANYLREKPKELWMAPLESPLMMVEVVEFYRRSQHARHEGHTEEALPERGVRPSG